jgi:Ni/Co efflux regulator RcnB
VYISHIAITGPTALLKQGVSAAVISTITATCITSGFSAYKYLFIYLCANSTAYWPIKQLSTSKKTKTKEEQGPRQDQNKAQGRTKTRPKTGPKQGPKKDQNKVQGRTKTRHNTGPKQGPRQDQNNATQSNSIKKSVFEIKIINTILNPRQHKGGPAICLCGQQVCSTTSTDLQHASAGNRCVGPHLQTYNMPLRATSV